jgi:peptidoglycan/xylan/chitin deacetylase (PgdA/CDA1 family)
LSGNLPWVGLLQAASFVSMKRTLFAMVAFACVAQSASAQAPAVRRAPNPNGRIPILEYHLIGEKDSRWGRSHSRFRADLALLYARGYRPITVAQLVDGHFDIPPGTSPVVFTFDDASPGQFSYVESNGRREIDPRSAVGIWLEFGRANPEWKNRATFCVLSGAAEGHAFFGEKGIAGQKSAWRFEKLRFLADSGFELCAHTLWHANLAKYSDQTVQEQIARSVLAIDSAVSGYRVRTFALPLGIWPRNRALARAGSWREPRTGREVRYAFDAVLLVAGNPVRIPGSPGFDPGRLDRIQVFGNTLESLLDRLDAHGDRFVAGGADRRSASLHGR